MRPLTGTYPPYFNNYIKLVSENELPPAFKSQEEIVVPFFKRISEEQSTYKYSEEKWTIKEILQHISDAERIFTYRALAFARNDQNTLPSFDENNYAANSNANDKTWPELIGEFIAVRRSTEALFNNLTEEQINSTGKAGDYAITVLALGFIIVGHVSHHMNIIKERYLDV